MQKRGVPVLLPGLYARQHNVAGLRVGKHTAVSDERERVEKTAHSSEQQAKRKALRPGPN
jgi:hypothetical protein